MDGPFDKNLRVINFLMILSLVHLLKVIILGMLELILLQDIWIRLYRLKMVLDTQGVLN